LLHHRPHLRCHKSAVVLTSATERNGKDGRKQIDCRRDGQMPAVQSLCNRFDEAIEHQVRVLVKALHGHWQ
jgi:hypothetical protein